MSIGRQAAHGVAWNMLLGVSSRVLQLIGTVILAHFMTPDEYGAVMFAAIVVLTASAVTSFSFGQYLIAKRGSPEIAVQAAAIHVTMGVAATLIVWLLRDVIGDWFGVPAMGQYVLGYAVAFLILDRVRYVPERITMRALRFRTLATINGLGDVAFTVAGTSPRGGSARGRT
jgi:lipopolysaccharide exporter